MPIAVFALRNGFAAIVSGLDLGTAEGIVKGNEARAGVDDADIAAL